MKNFLLLWTGCFIERGQKFSQNSKMKISTDSSKKYMLYEFRLEQPLQVFELNLIMIITKKSTSDKCSR